MKLGDNPTRTIRSLRNLMAVVAAILTVMFLLQSHNIVTWGNPDISAIFAGGALGVTCAGSLLLLGSQKKGRRKVAIVASAPLATIALFLLYPYLLWHLAS